MAKEIRIKRPDLGDAAENTVTAVPVAFKHFKNARKVGRTADDYLEYLINNILRVDGHTEPEPTAFWDELPISVHREFEDAFMELVPYEQRKELNILTNEEIADLRKKIEEEGIPESKKK